jgi:tetratricopeptide (TPR) repeat protein
MTDDKKKLPEDFADVDWDKALSEWDTGGMEPEVAKDVVTGKPATPPGAQPSRPLYRAPTNVPSRAPAPRSLQPTPARGVGPAPTPTRSVTPRAPAPRSPLPPPRSPLPPPRTPAPPPLKSPAPPPPGRLLGLEDEEEATVVTTIPSELLSRRGESTHPPPPPSTVPSVVIQTTEGVVTSAATVTARADRTAEPLRRPSLVEPSEKVAPDGTFDPFSDQRAEADPFAPPPPRPEAVTIDAEVDLLDELAAADDDVEDEEPLAEENTPVLPESHAGGPIRSGGSIHAPAIRTYGAEDDTAVTSEAAIAKIVQAATRAPSIAPPGAPRVPSNAIPRAPSSPSPTPVPPARQVEEAASGVPAITPSAGDVVPDEPRERAWADEKPAPEWMDETLRGALRDRATWLEQEARALADPVASARALLVCSEITASIGDAERAWLLADQARAAAPSLALAHRQARALMGLDAGAAEKVAALDVEAKMTPGGPARVHSMLLAAETLRANGDEAQAATRMDQIARAAAGDVRAPAARAARALARGEIASAALKLADTPALTPLAEAIATCLRLRGAPAPATKADVSASETLHKARVAIAKGDTAAAAGLLAELGRAVPELDDGARWAAASLGAPHRARRAEATEWLKPLAAEGDADAHRTLVTRAFETGDKALLTTELRRAEANELAPEDRVALATLAALDDGPADDVLESLAERDDMRALAFAATALALPGEGPERAARLRARAVRSAGPDTVRALTGLGRRLAAGADGEELDLVLRALGDEAAPGARAVALEMATRAGRANEVRTAIAAWSAARETAAERAAGALAAAVVAESGGDRAGALHAFKAARAADPTCEAAVRAVASLEEVDIVAEMNELADALGDGTRGAFARVEAVALGDEALPDPTKAQLLESAHKAAPTLPIAGFLAERIARRAGDADEALRWVRERRAHGTDPIELALDAVREALFVAEIEPTLAEERLREAHEARPSDVALRQMYERVGAQPMEDRASWREARAHEATGNARILGYLDAAAEYERAGDDAGALRSAEGAAATDTPFGRIARERAELRAMKVSRLSDELITLAKSAEDPIVRREAFERLAALDATAGNDAAGALLWHRSILEEQPHYKPSLRHVEQHLVREGRDDELEPVLAAIAAALKGAGSGESSAHAEAAARLRMRGAEGSWEATADLVEMAAAERDPTLWALRSRQAHARARGDGAAMLDATKRLVERASRAPERATLLARAGEAAAGLGQLDEAIDLLRRSIGEDPNDVATWGRLRDLCRQAGDPRGAAEASEAIARETGVEEHRLEALHEAAHLWLDEAADEDHAVAAFEGAAAIDVTYDDVFVRLADLYAARRMKPELASLLERRIERVTDPMERLDIELRRGRVLAEVGDVDGARMVFQTALHEHPDSVAALTAFADFCTSRQEWEPAEQTLVQLARLLPMADEQRDIYARLGDLYATKLVNLPRAEVAFKEVMKRSPDDNETAARLVDIYARQNDAPRAVELQQELVNKARSPDEKRARIVELAGLYEQIGGDTRRAEQVLEAARREFPQDVALLRALAELYLRHKQTPAFNILLDRAGADARRALSAGRLAPASFEILAAGYELRGRIDAARATQAMLATLEGRPAELAGAGPERALDSGLDDLIAPEAMTPALRALLAKTGDVLDAVTAIDLRAMKAAPVPAEAPIARLLNRVAAAIGLQSVQVLASPKVGNTCVPVGSSPPALLMGETLVGDERLGTFLGLRALKLVRIKASALGRTPPGELGVLVSAWLKALAPSWNAQGINAGALNAALAKMQGAVPRSVPADVGALALEIASTIGTRQATLGPAAIAWANRAALLALGDPQRALDAIAASAPVIGTATARGVPADPKDRAAWIGRTPEARDLIAFGVTEAFVEARTRLGLDKTGR